MFLKQVILKNFKSFKGKNIIDFPAVITGIVGPNGSGKSNIVDAIRWALGEQSFKNIRIDKGQDLIYAGNSNEGGASFCEVELIFDNQKKLFNSDFTEISILRRIDKEGNNEYFINHKAARLKDIIDLTASAKIGLKGFSIINQGSVENVLLAPPQERRLMLEEVLGLKNLELKKEEAKRKLEEANINLDKTIALEKEILPRLRFLKRQVDRWEKRETLENELKEKEKIYFISLLDQLLSEEKYQPQDFINLRNKLSKLDSLIKERENNLITVKENKSKDLELKIKNITQEIINLQDEKSELLRELGRKETKAEVDYSLIDFKNAIIKIKNVLTNLLKINEISEIHKKIEELLKDINQLLIPKKEEINNNEIEELKKKINSLQEQLKEKNNLLEQNETVLNQSNINFREEYDKITQLRNQKEEILKLIQKQELEKERYNLKLNDLKRRINEAGYQFDEINEYYQKNKTQVLAPNELNELERHIFRLTRELAEMGVRDENVIKEYEEVNTRYEFLSHQIEDLEKSINDLKLLIKTLTKEIENSFNEAISNINYDFNRYFRLMFNGGSAKLEQIKKNKTVLEEGENKAEVKEESQNLNDVYWGVEIKIDIPKTNLKSLEILSGGEKTLVAIALLFAIINQSRPPLVIVDEIDVALDEDNSRRFAQILKELCHDTQFIAITHNRMIMAAAQILYGVTLKDNSSQLLSIKLEGSEAILK
ncbi:MAG: AAA family ATPase [Minisyncoccia bacterium]|jgi:chromosome segregation protein